MSDYLKSILISVPWSQEDLSLDELMKSNEGQDRIKVWLFENIFSPLTPEGLEKLVKGLEGVGVVPPEPGDEMMKLLGVKPVEPISQKELDRLVGEK